MRKSKLFVAVFVIAIVTMFSAVAMAGSYYECVASGVEKNGSRKADVKFRVNADGVILAGQIVIPASTAKFAFPGGEYVYADGSKLTRDQDPYEWIMEANCVEKATQNRVTVMARKFRIQNIAELQIKDRAGSTWFVFPHGWEYKQVTDDK